jgi:phosphoribosylanthranilate isomerase
MNEIKNNYKKKIIMSLQIKHEQDVLKYKIYEKVVDIILFDSSGLHRSLSWNYDWIKRVPSSIVKMLAGNINMDMLKNIKEITDIVDVSGALETDKVKDLNKIKNFLNKVKQIND